MGYKGSHTRKKPGGYSGSVSILDGVSVKDLRYGDKVRLRVRDGRVVKAVVDLEVPHCWGGPRIALAVKDDIPGLNGLVLNGKLCRKLVFRSPSGGWSEVRNAGEPNLKEISQWLGEFEGDKPPTPMP